MARKRVYLRTVGHVASELGRLYRRADRGELEWSDARCASAVLRELRQTLEAAPFEERLAALEQAVGELGPSPARANGHARPGARL